MGLGRWLGYETETLTSPLPVAECLTRLRGTVQSEWAIFGHSPVVGRVGEKTFKLRKRLARGTYNSFQTYATGRLASNGASTLLTCRFGMHWFVMLFMALWLTPFLAIIIFFVAVDLGNSRAPDLESLLIPLVFASFGIALLGVGRAMARGERRFLLNFLEDTIEARKQHADREAAIEDLWRNA
ncbi:hypothetical protein [Dongia sedimenti]|uniref:Uncharacterized protein n=1 Tax=Dongia sedimenti TaxID=3064282 RepID=A0ABU0YLA6_9PROT|nr:hypothetical protein [Rhodospirillaceae bacterium R-7]